MFFFTYMFFFTNFSKKITFDGIALKMLPLERAKKMDHLKKIAPKPRFQAEIWPLLCKNSMNVEIYVFLRIFRKNRIFWGPLRFLYKHNHVKDRKKLTILKKRSASKTRFLADLWPILIYSINICFFYIFQSLKSIISRPGIEVSVRIFFLK